MESMADSLTRPRKTVDDFMKLPEGALAELIDGEIFMTPGPQVPHQRVVLNLTLELASYVRERRLGEILASPLDVHLPSGDIVEPDLIFVRRENESIIQDWIRGVPDLLIEVLSPAHPERDLIVKRDLYARNGVQEYWIVDPSDHSVQVWRLVEGRYEPSGYRRESQTLVTNLIPGLELSVTKVFE